MLIIFLDILTFLKPTQLKELSHLSYNCHLIYIQ